MSDDALGLDEAYSVKTPEDNKRLYESGPLPTTHLL